MKNTHCSRNKNLFFLLLVLAFLAFLPGCATDPVIVPGDQPSFAPDGMTPLLIPGYVIQVSVVVAGKKEVDEQSVRITEKGEINLPLIGAVPATSLTLKQLSATLEQKYSEYFIGPQVVSDFAKEMGSEGVSPWGYVNVQGRVVKPGRVGIPPTRDLTVSRAIQQAGGLSSSAKDSAIRVTRARTREVKEVNLRALGEKGMSEEDLTLQPGDIVFVPETTF